MSHDRAKMREMHRVLQNAKEFILSTVVDCTATSDRRTSILTDIKAIQKDANTGVIFTVRYCQDCKHSFMVTTGWKALTDTCDIATSHCTHMMCTRGVPLKKNRYMVFLHSSSTPDNFDCTEYEG